MFLYMYMHIHTITGPDTHPKSSQLLILLVIQPKVGLSLAWNRTEFIRTDQKFSGEPRSNSFHRTLPRRCGIKDS